MSSPFPGMDPYLETPIFWQGFHSGIIFCIGRALNAQLPSGFAANTEERVYLQWDDEATDNRPIRPDVLVRSSPSASTGRGVAILERPLDEEAGFDAPRDVFLLSPRERERFIEVVTTDAERRVVAVIEVLSPANKSTRAGRREYVNKQQSILQSDTHLLEIDLLRAGEFTVAVPEGAVREQIGAWDYLFSLHRGGEYDHFQYWSKTVRDPLPRKLLVPLTEGVPDATLDLQAVFDDAYDAGPYARQVNYAAEPSFPLRPDDASWVDALLQEADVRAVPPT